MSRVLVTGASGFVGRHTLGPLIAAGHEVHAVHGPSRGAIPDDPVGAIIWHGVDLLDERAGAGLLDRVRPERLLHLAWTVEHGRFWTDPRNRDWLSSSLLFIRHFAERGGRDVVVAGTSAEYDWTNLGHASCIEGRTPLRPATPYGRAKQELHDALRACDDLSGVRLAWGRLFLLFGPGEHPARLVPSVARALIRGEVARTTSGGHVRDFLDVRDAAAAFVALLESDVRGPVNVASGTPTPIGEVVRMLGEISGSPDLVRLGELPDRPDDPAVLVADVRRLTDEVRFRPVRSLREGLAQAFDWWRRHGQTANPAV